MAIKGLVFAWGLFALAGTGWGAVPAAAGSQAPLSPTTVAAREIVRVVGDRRLVLLGEKHGTREVPILVGELLDVWSRSGPVTLGLEIPRDEQPVLDRYLASPGDNDARTKLLSSPFWSIERGDQHDGRRSHDMLALIERIRVLHNQGRNVHLLAYDRHSADKMDHHGRDRAMAERVAGAHRSQRRVRVVVLAGNVHAMLRRPASAPPQMQLSMGWHLRDRDPFAIDIVAQSGHFWGCTTRCGPVASIAPPRSQRLQGDVFHYVAVLPVFTVARLVGAP